MNGPVWKPGFGVTGEPHNPNYVTTTDANGKTVTLTGAAADAHRIERGIVSQ